MDKMRKVFQRMSLKKSLMLLAVCCLGFVSILSFITIFTFSNLQRKILDTRPIVVTSYILSDTEETRREPPGGVTVVPQEYVHGELSKQNQIYFGCVTAGMVILPVLYMIAASVLVAKLYYKLKLQKPLESLRKGMDHISRQDLDFQIPYISEDELGKLCTTFEKMKNEIYQSNCGMWELLQERKALTASISHDLRTPITVLKGYLEYLDKAVKKERLTEESLQTTVSNMTAAVNRLERYVDCVKDIQKIEEITIKKEVCNFKDFTAKMTEEFSILANQHKKQLEIQDYGEVRSVETDPDMLSKIMENIFDNALRFSVDKIVLTIDETKEEILFIVEDDGAGFTPEELRTAVSAFYSSDVNGGNFGIGLTICKILCEKLGGALGLDNSSHGGGKVMVKIKK
ncbi:MAG: HAMP domain-containing histidine kinase [Clostridiales bacterium]|nr:HAMP domain-containing histidine kinase [Clostridiales bacterium]